MFLYNFLSLTKSFNSYAIRFKLSQGYCPCKSISYLLSKKKYKGFPPCIAFCCRVSEWRFILGFLSFFGFKVFAKLFPFILEAKVNGDPRGILGEFAQAKDVFTILFSDFDVPEIIVDPFFNLLYVLQKVKWIFDAFPEGHKERLFAGVAKSCFAEFFTRGLIGEDTCDFELSVFTGKLFKVLNICHSVGY